MLYEILKARTKPSDKALYNIWARKLSGGWSEQEITAYAGENTLSSTETVGSVSLTGKIKEVTT